MQGILRRLILISVIVGFAKCEFYIVQSPSSMKFSAPGETAIPRSELSGIINFLFGLPSQFLQSTKSWPGLESFDVFDPPKLNALITVHVPTGSTFSPKKFEIEYKVAESVGTTMLVDRLNSALLMDGGSEQSFSLEGMYPGSLGEVDMAKLSDRLAGTGSVLSMLPSDVGPLAEDDETRKLLGELQMLCDVMGRIGDTRNRQSLHILLTALDGLAHKYGPSSSQVKTGIRLYQLFIEKLNVALEKKFKNEIIVEVDTISNVPTAAYLTRRKRDISSNTSSAGSSSSTTVANQPSNTAPINVTTVNLATPTHENYPVIFSIVLWLMVAFFLAALAASYSMFFMDPGKDNIIYRATAGRMKSD